MGSSVLKKLRAVPDWVGSAVFTIMCSIVSFAYLFGQLRTQVFAEVTAQTTNTQDVKRISSDLAEVKATVKAIDRRQDRMEKLLLAFLNR